MLKLAELFGKREAETERHDAELLEDIDEVVNEIGHCRRRFNLVTDSDLIDAVIYEELALRSRYAYLLKQARSSGLTGRTVLK